MARTKNIKTNEKEEWIWVKGFKGTDKNMCCRAFQFRLNEEFNMSDDAPIKECESGFHLCKHFEDVFRHYNVTDNNRFFEVSALVRKSDYDTCEKIIPWVFEHDSKMAAKAIIFVRELTDDEIFEALEKRDVRFKNLPQEYRHFVKEGGIDGAERIYRTDTLVKDGYSEPFALYLAKYKDKFEIAHAVAAVPDLSMDMKVFCIFNGIKDGTFNMSKYFVNKTV